MDPAPTSVQNSIRALYDVKNCVHRSYIPDKSSYILQRLYQPRFFTRRCVARVRASVCDVSKTAVVRAKYEPGPRHAQSRMDRPADSRLFSASGVGHVTDAYLQLRGGARESAVRDVQKCKPTNRRQSSEKRMRKRFIKRGE